MTILVPTAFTENAHQRSVLRTQQKCLKWCAPSSCSCPSWCFIFRHLIGINEHGFNQNLLFLWENLQSVPMSLLSMPLHRWKKNSVVIFSENTTMDPSSDIWMFSQPQACHHYCLLHWFFVAPQSLMSWKNVPINNNNSEYINAQVTLNKVGDIIFCSGKGSIVRKGKK